MKIVIIGAGVIGLSCAYYLSKEGHEVIIIDRSNNTNSCSYGNAGYICPSHFIPLASPGIVAQGLKWMLSSTSPFYIKPRLDGSLLKWGWQFYQKANEKTVKQNAPHLHNILQLSRNLIIDMNQELNNGFQLEEKGCLMLYKSTSTAKHEADIAVEAQHFGIEAPILSLKDVQAMEPNVELDVLGGVYFPMDCHLHPARMMESLKSNIQQMGVKFLTDHEVQNFEAKDSKVLAVITDKARVECDHLVLAAGAWLETIAKKLGIHLLLQPGKGYSTTYGDIKNNLVHPSILVDDKVAMTPLKNELRVGGTMELGGINHTVNMSRVKPIISSANLYYPGLKLQVPQEKDVWSGLRPCSPDGLPYIGNSEHHKNVTVAGGHAMLGISLAAATGLLVKQIIQHESTEIPIQAFTLYR